MSNTYRYIDEAGSFEWEGAENDLGLYFPLAGAKGLKSAITPNGYGDLKLDQNHFVMEPASIENLRNNRAGRNFWCLVEGKQPWSAVGASAEQELARFSDEQEKSVVRAGKMWHETERENAEIGLKSTVTSFVPVDGNVEVMQVKITNIASDEIALTGIAAIPVYGRSADNLRDHRHVTSLLHRTFASAYGIHVEPSLSFDERGHQKGDTVYFVEGIDGEQNPPKYLIADLDEFIGAAGTWTHPEAVYRFPKSEVMHATVVECTASSEADASEELQTAGYENSKKDPIQDGELSEASLEEKRTLISTGQEILGGLIFADVKIPAGESHTFLILIGAAGRDNHALIANERERFFVEGGAEAVLQQTKDYWKKKAAIHMQTGDESFDRFMEWVSFQPELRKIYGCSFLPHHDYGKGGRGWRDLWQDCLALLLTDPDSVKDLLLSNFAGVRFDGTNATIIGEKPGEFKADRNAITRVWSDHGIWPLITTKLYMDQTGDLDMLYRTAPYFKDRQVKRGRAVDAKWDAKLEWQRDISGKIVEGTVLEHLLLQQLTSYYEVGDHGNMQLRDADWNDALDMAGHRGETVAFTCALAMNLKCLAEILQNEAARGVKTLQLHKEISWLLYEEDDADQFPAAKRRMLDFYLQNCVHEISGEWTEVSVKETSRLLMEKAEEIMAHVRKSEWITDQDGDSWFNSYYDDHGNRVEGNGKMMLTGQVFAVMSGTATDAQTESIIRAADKYLYDASCGGYRLNTDFHELRTDLGRMFGFAYGEKENGAVFSHMAVMYANALYSRGYSAAGHKALQALYLQSANTEASRIYPGIPEYFGKGGRGLYHYLTGAASWYLMTMVNQVFGIRGENGDLRIQPKLQGVQFDAAGEAALQIPFAGKKMEFRFRNPKKLDADQYQILQVKCNGRELTEGVEYRRAQGIVADAAWIRDLPADAEITWEMELG